MGYQVIAVPMLWRLDEAPEGEESDAEALCAHVARQTFGDHVRVVEHPLAEEHESLYSHALAQLASAAHAADTEFAVVDRDAGLVRVGESPGRLLWARLVRMDEIETDEKGDA